MLSVVVPAYNREDVAEECIRAVCKQSLEKSLYEIVVVDDASTDSTFQILSSFQAVKNFKLYQNKTNRGPAATRNFGVEQANGKVILFLDIDVIATETLLEKQLRWHQQNSEKVYALVGRTTWHPAIEITPFMNWLEHGGPMVDFSEIKSNEETNFLHFYTGNISLKKEFFLENRGFSVDFSAAGSPAYEDTELGLRLEKSGLRLFYDAEALGYHREFKTLEEVCTRRYQYGKMARHFRETHPDIERYFRDELKYKLTKPVVNKLTIKILEPLADFFQGRLYTPLLFWLVCRHYYNLGMDASK